MSQDSFVKCECANVNVNVNANVRMCECECANANVVARFCAAMNVMYAVQGPIALSLCRTESYYFITSVMRNYKPLVFLAVSYAPLTRQYRSLISRVG